MMGASKVLRKLLKECTDISIEASAEWRNRCDVLFRQISDEIICDIVGIHAEWCDGLSTDYYLLSSPVRIEVNFWESATHTAEQIATQFRTYADIPIIVTVTEKTSQFEST